MSDMRVNLCGVTLKNPVIAASGTFGYGMEYNEFYSISRLGGISCKGTAIEEWKGNPTPRIAETPAGMLNSVGLQNPGVDALLNIYLPWLKGQDIVVIANAAGHSLEPHLSRAEQRCRKKRQNAVFRCRNFYASVQRAAPCHHNPFLHVRAPIPQKIPHRMQNRAGV
jgi:dihydroorotate dehydrogenase